MTVQRPMPRMGTLHGLPCVPCLQQADGQDLSRS